MRSAGLSDRNVAQMNNNCTKLLSAVYVFSTVRGISIEAVVLSSGKRKNSAAEI